MIGGVKSEEKSREKAEPAQYLLIGIKAWLLRDMLGLTQAAMAEKVGLELPDYKDLEEAQHAPNSKKTLQLVEAGIQFHPEDAVTWISKEIVDLICRRRR